MESLLESCGASMIVAGLLVLSGIFAFAKSLSSMSMQIVISGSSVLIGAVLVVAF